MKAKIKKLVPEAHIPQYMKPGDVGMDLVAISKVFDEAGNVVYGTGIAIEVPEGFVGLIFPRSNNYKKDLLLASSIGIVNPNDKDEIILRFKPAGYFASIPNDLSDGNISETYDFICFGKEDVDDVDTTALYNVGDRIGQLVILPRPVTEWVEVVEFTTVGAIFNRKGANHTGGDFQGSHLL